MARKKQVQPAWHPNFRDLESLPDIKVVRTDFLLNILGIALAVVAMGFVAFNEVIAFRIGTEVSKERELRDARSSSDKANVAQSNKFAREAMRLQQVEAFVESPGSISRLLLDITRIVPQDMVIENLDYSFVVDEQGRNKAFRRRLLDIRGTVNGTPEEAPLMVDEFKRGLMSLPELEGEVESIELASLEREGELDVFSFFLKMRMYRIDTKTGEKDIPKEK